MDQLENSNDPGEKRPSAPVTGGTDTTTGQLVTLVKGVHRWTFVCDPGDEPELLRSLSELAGRGGVPFDWFDAALVSHQIARRLKPGLNRIDKTADGPGNHEKE